MYAAGKFPGGWMKREGRPSTDATLTARLIDRPIRPMFAEGFRNEVQVINTVLSYDLDVCPSHVWFIIGIGNLRHPIQRPNRRCPGWLCQW